ncbi:glycosyltransferase 61 family protein [Pectobacterium aroidearum]|uniref:glycosyltransferase 61 family protein n=1 Tax=Pectobacterium aroidearum TaxID=1201031 RepID=UPI00211580C4|nr:glycosyltransferase 61 family protein [Pectobacterium aroidearum]UUE43774.1 glycosyltransferase family 61 protein [Pectobacterium aroidearum]UUE47995.1 glycosyltransferase family 61 protein [Pectobacterium aroidearum]UUE52200.1 glycosyltransferase family 61 protein [Pectobacterium aroidearum]UUE60608.1 glycosyltransferase family 61 protein [Pectobacterium aroidearum]UUE64831.1 glycosyltransferase family 61 protein [Pectobacterium aroidearum]
MCNSDILIQEKNDLKVEDIPNGIVLPHLKINNGPKWGLGGVVDSNKNFVKSSGLYRNWISFGGIYELDDMGIKNIDEDVIWFGFFYKHWGHFLVDFISRMWFLLSNYNGEYIVYVSSKDSIDGNFLEFLNLLGVPGNKLLRITSPTRFKKIIIPEYSFSENEYNKSFLSIFERIINNALVNGNSISDKKNTYDRVYFSRQAFSNALSKECGESIIESVFIDNGFESVYPERLSLVEQIIIWNESKWIVSMNGTIPLNLVFCMDKNKKITVLNKTHHEHKNLLVFQNIFSMGSVEYVNIYNNKYCKLAKNLGDGPFVLDKTKDLTNYCMENLLNIINEKHHSNIAVLLFLIRFYIRKYFLYLAKKMYGFLFINR